MTQNGRGSGIRRLFGRRPEQADDTFAKEEAPFEPIFPPPGLSMPPAQRSSTGKGFQPAIVIVRPIGALANRMIQHMTALSITAKVPGARISRIHLPEWGLEEAEIRGTPASQHEIGGMNAQVDLVAEKMLAGKLRVVTISGYVQNMENFLSPDAYRKVFVTDRKVEVYGDDVLLINLRMAEILSADYPPYVLIPISFYRQLIRETGLRPVFFGQITPSLYLDDLRAAFPDAAFVPGVDPIHDFETLRRSKNIVAGVSTFSWLACWLSEASHVFMPLTGLFNPVFAKVFAGGLDLVPKRDPRYLLYHFPINSAVPQDQYRDVHAMLDGRWRPVSGAWVEALLQRHASLKPDISDFLAIFDEDFYLSMYPGIGEAKRAGGISSGRGHYEAHGFAERRLPCRLERGYEHRNPEAAVAVANGEYFDLIHFHAARGRHLGYK